MIYPTAPTHLFPEKSIWEDVKGRMIICHRIWRGDNEAAEIIIFDGKDKLIEFKKVPFESIKAMIDAHLMVRCYDKEGTN